MESFIKKMEKLFIMDINKFKNNLNQQDLF